MDVDVVLGGLARGSIYMALFGRSNPQNVDAILLLLDLSVAWRICLLG